MKTNELKHAAVAAILALGTLAIAGCTEDPVGPAGPPDAGRVRDAAADTGPGALPSGLPCSVAAPLQTYCTTCHGAAPVAGALMPLVSAADLAGPAVTDHSRRVVDLALERMRSTMRPMPPTGPRVPDADIAAIQAWVDMGMPSGTCDLYDPFAEPLGACTTGTHWLFGNHESPLMRPGGACIQCHDTMRRGPILTLAGTVYQTGHEASDCNGVDGFAVDYTVEVTDATGHVIRMLPNSAGNFISQMPVTFPITARVYAGDRERRMITPSMSGDCNSCHTDVGTTTEMGGMVAPGRIAMP